MKLHAVGYKALIEKFQIEEIAHWHYSSVHIDGQTHKDEKQNPFNWWRKCSPTKSLSST